MTDKNYDPTLKGAFTRLANTQGYFVIETIPNGPQGLVYDLWLQNRTATKPEDSFFKGKGIFCNIWSLSRPDYRRVFGG